MDELRIEYLPLDALTPYERNARAHGEDDIAATMESIRVFGFRDPIGVWGPRNIIVEGHGRLMAAKRLGLPEVPVIRLDDMSDEQRRAYALAHNRTAELSRWDETVREMELERITEIDMSAFRFDLSDMREPEPITEDTIPDVPASSLRVNPGDVFMLGDHRLMCGDSTDPTQIDDLLSGHFVRLTVTSPPYGVGKDYEEKGITAWRETINGVVNAIKKKTLIIAWNIGDLFSTGTQFTEPTGAYSVQIMEQAGYRMLYNRIWKKPGGNFAGNNPYYTVTTKPVQDYEYLFAFAETDADRHLEPLKKYLFEQAEIAKVNNDLVKSLNGPKFMCGHWFSDHQWSFIDKSNYARLSEYCQKNKIEAFQENYDELQREYQNSIIFSHNLTKEEFSSWGLYGVWEFSTVHERLGGHAAAFPVELPARFIKIHTQPGDFVLDPFGGTGTTLIACEQLRRRCFMMERDPKYCGVIIERWEKLTSRKAIKQD